MNLDPVWDADAIMMPVEDIVRSKQLMLESKAVEFQEASQQHQQQQGPPCSRDLDTRPHHISKFATHQSDILCAIGGTTAHEVFSLPGSKKHMSIAEETTVCLQTVECMSGALHIEIMGPETCYDTNPFVWYLQPNCNG